MPELMLVLLYFVPFFIAMLKRKRNAGAIGLLNFCLGWTVIGWFVALIWAATTDAPGAVVQKITLDAAPAPVTVGPDDLAFLADLRAQHKAKLLIAALVLLAAVVPARAQNCGPEARQGTTQSNRKSALETDPPTDKALVYVTLPENVRFFQSKVSVDREWIGINRGKTYFVVAIAPGAHEFCSEIMNRASYLRLTLEAGQSYYLRFGYHGLTEVAPEDGPALLRKCSRTEFFEKGKP